jgi:NAD(P)-dependent dehydrogenase (short-subunit alcohol dehydrogenase family)
MRNNDPSSFNGSDCRLQQEPLMSSKPVALVTGANQGIGLQIAKNMVGHGYTVLVGARDIAKGEAAAEEIGPDAHALQLDVTDQASIMAAAARVREEFGRLDVLIQNAAISHTGRREGESVEAHAAATRASNVSLEEMRAVWDTNVFGVLAVYQAMLPILRATPGARIVNVSSGVGSLATNLDPTYPYRGIFGPVYPASKTALNALTVAMALELEPEGIRVCAVSPGYTKTNLNGYQGVETLEEGAREAVRVAMLGPGAPTGTFTRWEGATIPW